MEGYTGHDVDEKTGDFVKTVEDHAVPPHGYGDCVVTEGQTVGADEQALRVREEPYCEDAHKVNEVAEVGQEVVVSAFVVSVVPDGHKV